MIAVRRFVNRVRRFCYTRAERLTGFEVYFMRYDGRPCVSGRTSDGRYVRSVRRPFLWMVSRGRFGGS